MCGARYQPSINKLEHYLVVSPSLQAKINKMQRLAPSLVPKATLCADVILAAADLTDPDRLAEAIAALKRGVGQNWSVTHALQFMSGRQAEIIVPFAEPALRVRLQLAHLLGKAYCDGKALTDSVTAEELLRLTALAHNASHG